MLLLYSIEGEIKQRMLPVALRGSMDRLCAELEAVRPAVILPTPTLKPLISATGSASSSACSANAKRTRSVLSDPGVEMVAVRLQSAVLLRAPAFASRVWVVHSEGAWLSIGPLELAA